MSLLKRLLFIVLFLSVVIVGAWFANENVEPVVLSFAGYSSPSISSGLAFLIILFVGVLLGMAVGAFTQVIVWRRCRKAERKLKLAEQELQKLRVSAVRD
ncbi:MAG: LapA family protein [Cellvibrionaceae bacterium]